MRLSAYAAASPAQSIATLVDILASADDALQRYTHAVDAWREQFVALKNLKDDVLRDRDILCVPSSLSACTRSPAAQRHPSHQGLQVHPRCPPFVPLGRPLTSLVSASLSLSSTNPTIADSISPASTNARLALAEAEFQACETHLVTKERELDARRISIV